MNEFISINDETLINKSEIQKIERYLFDLDMLHFQVTDTNTGEVIDIECDSIHLATIFLKNGDSTKVMAEIYSEDDYSKVIENHWMNLIRSLHYESVYL